LTTGQNVNAQTKRVTGDKRKVKGHRSKDRGADIDRQSLMLDRWSNPMFDHWSNPMFDHWSNPMFDHWSNPMSGDSGRWSNSLDRWSNPLDKSRAHQQTSRTVKTE
jgi:hypothetical protein